MKKSTSIKKIQANKLNSILGGAARAALCLAAYEATPTYCTQCFKKLPQSKKNNKFCSISCAATFNNTGRIKVHAYKCAHCDNMIKRAKFCSMRCSQHSRVKHNTIEEKLIAKRKRDRESSANYRTLLKNQSPLDIDRKAIRSFYDNCPLGYEVDHIIPISKGGPHTLKNLQYLTTTENRQKSNKLVGATGNDPVTREL